MTVKKYIFGYRFVITFDDYHEYLQESLSYYPDYCDEMGNLKTVRLHITQRTGKIFSFHRPFLAKVDESGYMVRYRYADIKWDLQHIGKGAIDVEFIVNRDRIKSLRFIERFASQDYLVFPENFEAKFHMNVLIPTVLLFQDKVIFRGASVYNRKMKKSIIITGTNNIGKTTAMLRLLKDKDWLFLGDDFSVIDENAIIYPCFRYPFVRAFSVTDDRETENKILSNESLSSRLHWALIKRINSSKVVRRIPPALLYNVEHREVPLDAINLIHRETQSNPLTVKEMDVDEAAERAKEINYRFLRGTLRILQQYEDEAIANGLKPHIRVEQTLDIIGAKHDKIFSKVERNWIQVSPETDYDTFYRFFSKIAYDQISS